jgi:hypothetical protein
MRFITTRMQKTSPAILPVFGCNRHHSLWFVLHAATGRYPVLVIGDIELNFIDLGPRCTCLGCRKDGHPKHLSCCFTRLARSIKCDRKDSYPDYA